MQQYRIETHMHTSETSACAAIPGEEIVRLYKQRGYDTVIITDHFHPRFVRSHAGLSWQEKVERYLAGFRAAAAEGSRIGVHVILGMELRFTEGPNDYLAYGFHEDFLFNNPDLHELGLKRFRGLTLPHGIRIYQAHPFRKGMQLADPALIDGIEVFNGNVQHDSGNSAAKAYAEQQGLAMISGSDAHWEEDLGNGGLVSPRPVTTREELVELLISGDYQLLGDWSS